MALDIRLDFINKISQENINKMTEIRKKFIELDKQLMEMHDEAQQNNLPEAMRTISLARSNNEIACQFAIKSLCILGEIK